MSVVIGFLRHFCEGESGGPLAILGQLDKNGASVYWGVDIPGGPQPYQFAWHFCPHCGGQLPLTMDEWEKGSKGTNRKIGFTKPLTMEDEHGTIGQ